MKLGPIVMPSELELPPGSHRRLLMALQVLYRQAGFPSTREISKAVERSAFARDAMSHQTVANVLAGRCVPRWLKVEALVDALLILARRETEMPEIERFRSLWLALHSTSGEYQESTSESSPDPSHATGQGHVRGVGTPVEGQSEEIGSPGEQPEPRTGHVLADVAAQGEGSIRTRLVAAGWDGPEMFEVSFIAGVCKVELNLRHPMGKEIWKIMDREDDEASTVLALLIISWARMEDEMPSARVRERIKAARIDWGRYARLYVEQARK
ncbi:hypothetical protein [Streptomyces niveus]